MAYGAILSPPDERDYKAKDYISMGIRPKEYMPKKFAPVLDQGDIHSCCAHAMATLKWYQEYRERKSEVEWSTDGIYHNRKDSDHQGQGMIVREMLSQMRDCGVCKRVNLPTNTEYPNRGIKQCVIAMKEEALPQKIKSYIRCNTDDEIKEAVYQYGGAILTVASTPSFAGFYFQGDTLKIPKASEKTLGYHTIVAVGYNEKGFLIQNSWGELWGDSGFAFMPYGYPVKEAWSVMDDTKQWDITELTIGSKIAFVNGEETKIDTPPQIVNGRTMVPLRFIAEAFGFDVEWVESDKKVIIRGQIK